MSDRQDLLDKIKDMNEASIEIRWRHEKAMKELIGEFLEDLNSIPSFQHEVQMFILNLKRKWEERRK